MRLDMNNIIKEFNNISECEKQGYYNKYHDVLSLLFMFLKRDLPREDMFFLAFILEKSTQAEVKKFKQKENLNAHCFAELYLKKIYEDGYKNGVDDLCEKTKDILTITEKIDTINKIFDRYGGIINTPYKNKTMYEMDKTIIVLK